MKTDILIAGAGLNGLIAALVCGDVGLRTQIIERHSQEAMLNAGADGRASTIAATSFELLRNLGLAEDLLPYAQPIWEIRVTEADQFHGYSPFFLHFSAKQLAKGQPFGYVVENTRLMQVFYQHAQAHPQIQIQHDVGVARMTLKDTDNLQMAFVRTDDDKLYQTQLVIACDGRNSPLRKQAGIDAHEWDYHQHAIITAVFHEYDHGGIAIEQFMKGGPFAILPMSEQRSAIVWTEKSDYAKKIANLSDSEFLILLRERFATGFGKLALAAPRQIFPLVYRHAKHYHQHRFLLLGDAAHAIHPLAGQGLNLGLRDSGALWDLLKDAQRLGLDIGREEVLQNYTKWRRKDNHAVSAMTDQMNSLFSNQHLPLKIIRTLGLGMVENITPLKNYFASRAMGLRVP